MVCSARVCTMKNPRRLIATGIAGALVALGSAQVLAQVTPEATDEATADALLPALVFDRVDTNERVWRLSDLVATATSPEPTDSRAVYLQFGFMSCEPCHLLADLARQELGDDVALIYVHLDDVEMNAGGETLPQLWTRLDTFMEENEHYEDFLAVRRGNTNLMYALCDSRAAPSALLVAPNGEYVVLATPTEDEAEDAFEEFRDSLSD